MNVRLPPQRIGCLRRFRPAGRARVRLLCFAHAGGGAQAYRALATQMPEHVDVLAVQYGAREDRYHEPASTGVRERVAEAVAGARTLPALPWVLFGHSMGALLAYETARAVGRLWPGEPRLLIASGCDAPLRPAGSGGSGPRPVPSDEEILAGLRDLGATPPAVLHDRAVVHALLPALRADYTMLAGYTGGAAALLECPLAAWTGSGDSEVSQAGMSAWAGLTRGPFHERSIEGDHFWLVKRPHVLRDLLLDELERLAGFVPGSPSATVI